MMLKTVSQDMYQKEVIRSNQPTLLCFFKKTVFQSATVVSIEELSRQFKSIQFYTVQEDEHLFFFHEFHFFGTPIFLFLANGREQARLMGSVSTDRLRVFLESNLGSFKRQRYLPARGRRSTGELARSDCA